MLTNKYGRVFSLSAKEETEVDFLMKLLKAFQLFECDYFKNIKEAHYLW